VADNTVWSHWQVASRSSEVIFTKNCTLLYLYLLQRCIMQQRCSSLSLSLSVCSFVCSSVLAATGAPHVSYTVGNFPHIIYSCGGGLLINVPHLVSYNEVCASSCLDACHSKYHHHILTSRDFPFWVTYKPSCSAWPSDLELWPSGLKTGLWFRMQRLHNLNFLRLLVLKVHAILRLS